MYRIILFFVGLFFVYQGGRELLVAMTESEPQAIKHDDLIKNGAEQTLLKIEGAKFDIMKSWYKASSSSAKDVNEFYVALLAGEGKKSKYILQSENEKLLKIVSSANGPGVSDADALMALAKLSKELDAMNPVQCMVGDWSDVDSDIENMIKKDEGISKDVIFLYHDKSVSMGMGFVKLAGGGILSLVIVFTFIGGGKEESAPQEVKEPAEEKVQA